MAVNTKQMQVVSKKWDKDLLTIIGFGAREHLSMNDGEDEKWYIEKENTVYKLHCLMR